MTPDPPRVLIVDDHPVVRDGLRVLFDSVHAAIVIGEAATGEAAVNLTHDLRPDVVLMDIEMPGSGGIRATREITDRFPGVGVLVLTMHDDDASIFAAMRAGARGYVVKGSHQADILRAVQAVARGDAIFGPGVAERVLSFLGQNQRPSPPSPFPTLTPREQHVLELIAAGQPNDDIATLLGLSLKTVRNHVSNVLMKLSVADRAQAVARARDAGIGQTASNPPSGRSHTTPAGH